MSSHQKSVSGAKSAKCTFVHCKYTDTIHVNGDLEQAHEWWVKWGKVHVVWKEGQTVEVYGEDDKMQFWKRPDDVDTEEVGAEECGDCDMD